MESFKNFYEELFKNIPEPYSRLGHFGSGTWYSMIEEGLITSYPFESLKKIIDNDELHVPGAFIGYNNDIDRDSFTVDVSPTNSSHNIKDIAAKLNAKLAVYGWFVGNIKKISGDYLAVIEKKIPDELSREEIGKMPFFHITHRKYLDNIETIGLTPRESQTVFTHPGGRIYLVQAKSPTDSIIRDLSVNVPQNKDKVERERLGPERYAKKSTYVQPWTPNNIAILQVTIPPNVKVYRDPMVPDYSNGSSACFVIQNIPPQYIKEI